MEEQQNFKSRLLLLLSKQQGEFLADDSKFNIKLNYEELMKIITNINENPNENIFEFIYSYKQIIHTILYNEDENINIDNFKFKITFAKLYYLYLLIKENKEIINYEYSFQFIKRIYNLIKNIKQNNKLLKIVT